MRKAFRFPEPEGVEETIAEAHIRELVKASGEDTAIRGLLIKRQCKIEEHTGLHLAV
jgi:hypothetical protein